MENLEFVKLSNIKIVEPNEQTLKELTGTIALYAKKKTSDKFSTVMDRFVQALVHKDGFVAVSIDNVDLPLIKGKRKLLINFNLLDSIPPSNINLLYSIVFYALGYYVSLYSNNLKFILAPHIGKIFFGMFVRLLGRSQGLMSLDNWKLEFMQYACVLYIYYHICEIKDVANKYGTTIIKDNNLQNALKIKNVNIIEETHLSSISGLLDLFREKDIVNINKNIYGYLVISDIINNVVVTQKYSGYTKKEAIKMFKENE